MGHTNSTVNYNLPQFVGTDKPSWLGDVNGAFLAIDTAIAEAKTEADSAAGGVAGLQITVGGHTTQIGTLTDTATAQGGTLNSVTALIGNGTPTTTDQTIIGAINELHADITQDYIVNTSQDASQATAQAPWICESDGYIKILNNNSSGDVTIMIDENLGLTHYFGTDRPYESFSTFVKKGCRFYVNRSQTFNGYIQFHTVTSR